ncbi:DUF6701 domain-containing protein [Photobacterium minamisatsumaniensis]|uniref:DUF6701 domain-containing protein n=1 Tax=Photobacterium minamisatsumaniensis TaxID=2910233 RepID=UPI003D0AD89B
MNKIKTIFWALIVCFFFPSLAHSAIDFSQCPFTGPAQTWSRDGDVEIDGAGEINGAVDGMFLGFNEVDSQPHGCGKHQRCYSNLSYPEKNLLVDKPLFVSFKVNNNERKLENDAHLSPARYKKIEIISKAKVTLAPGEYWVDEFVIKEKSELIISGAVTLNVNKLILDDKATINHSGSPSNLVIIAHKNDGEVELKSKTEHEFSAYIIANDDVLISEKTRVRGAVTAYELKVEKQGKLTADLNGCNVTPEEPEYSDDAQFQFGTQSCSAAECEIQIDNIDQYTLKPLVFLMPTIDQGSPDDDPPATLAVKSVDLNDGKVIIEQVSPSGIGAAATMTQVSYLIMEPGKANFHGKEVVAGYVDTTEYQATSGDDRGWERDIALSDWGGGSLSNPVFLTQQQGLNRDHIFSTSAITNITAGKSDLAIELGRGTVHPANKRRVAFLASSVGTGETDTGIKFEFGVVRNLNQTGTLAESCQNLRVPFANNYTVQLGVVGMKQTRNGPHGGWIRRCELTPSDFSFVFDEDTLGSRKHRSAEDVGYFAFGTDFQMPEHCEYFPGPVQSHSEQGKIEIYDQGFIHGQVENFKLGFNSINDGSGLGDESCRTDSASWKCQLNQNLVVDSVDLPQFPSGGSSESFYDGKTHVISFEKTYQRIEAGSTSTVKLAASGDYWIRNLTLNGQAKLVVSDGIKVRLFVERLQTNIDSSINHSGNPDDFILVGVGANANIHLTGETTFHGMVYSENQVTLDSKFNFNDDITQMPATITGAVTARQVFMSGTSNIRSGGMCFTPPEQNYQITVSPEQDLSLTCDRQPVEFQVLDENGAPAGSYDGQVNITSTLTTANKAFWYLSEQGGDAGKLDISQSHAFNVDTDGKVTLWLKSDVVGTISATGRLSTDSGKSATGQYGFVPFKFEIADSYLPTVAGKPSAISIKAKACKTDNNDEVSVGYDGKRTLTLGTRYDAPNSGSQNIELRAATTTANWVSDEIELDFKRGIASAELRYLDAGKTTLTLTDPQCSLAEGCEILPDSQTLAQYTLGDWTQLEGTQSVWSRPYTFALCNAGEPYIEGATGTADIPKEYTNAHQVAFLPAGHRFSTLVKPVIWDDDGAFSVSGKQADVDSTALCERPVTQNFFRSDAPTVNVVLSHQLHTPENQQAGQLSGTLSLSNTEIESKPFTLSWDEVGSIKLLADTSVNYLGMDVNAGYRFVGRFYPDAFAIVSAESGKQYPDGQSFVYMNQSFKARFKVEAQNAAGGATQNYGHFVPSKQIGLEIEAIDSSIEHGPVNRLSGRMDWHGLPDGWEKDWQGAHVTIPWSPFMFQRDITAPATPSTSIITTEDGPYDVALGILREDLSFAEAERIGYPEIDGDMDVVYCNGEEDCREPRAAMKFADFNTRYGRMVMDDGAGRSDASIAIPLRVEYWNGDEFTTHFSDNVSAFDGQYSCKQIIAQPDSSVTSGSYTEGKDLVTAGEAPLNRLVAKLETKQPNYREQVRFWQKLVNTIPQQVAANNNEISCKAGTVEGRLQPWLLYNWRGVGDENPSAVVTFGVYRGNDRILYRGEKGINTLLN